MISVDVKVVKDEATDTLELLYGITRNKSGLVKVLGRTAVRELRRHFHLKDRKEPNRLGGKRTHFWNEVSDSVQQPEIKGSAAVVTISHPAYSHKITGGTIRSRRGKWLTIPLISEAHGRYASVLSNKNSEYNTRHTPEKFSEKTGSTLFLYKSKAKGNRFLARYEGNGLELVYLLRKQVSQKADKTAFPDESNLFSAVVEQAEKFVGRELERTYAR